MLLVETTGNHQLVTYRARLVIRSRGCTLVPRSPEIEVWQVQGKLRLVAEVSDQATDAEWLIYVAESDGDPVLAREAFLSAFPLSPVEPPPPPPRGSRKRT